ncbi:MAG: DUF3473 domain-containing protein [Reinekea sp.]|nr:DUF3473 domain-containing protein [Reinekea sp.]
MTDHQPQPKAGMGPMLNAMTIDVEDYFHVSAFESMFTPDKWKDVECRVERNVDCLLRLFDQHDVKATFFVLGWVAEHYPDLIRRIVAQGHELASHGTSHQRATTQSEDEFRQDVESAKKLLEDIGGVEVQGYRAPSFSFNKTNEWVYDVLASVGYRYSSSVYPVKHDLYGVPDAPRTPYRTDNGFLEIPMSTLTVGAKNIPVSGGGFFRLYPYLLTKFAVSRLNHREAMSHIFYLHPWEVDPEQPRVSGAPLKSRFRHYLNLKKVEPRLKRLMTDFKWGTMRDTFGLNIDP